MAKERKQIVGVYMDADMVAEVKRGALDADRSLSSFLVQCIKRGLPQVRKRLRRAAR